MPNPFRFPTHSGQDSLPRSVVSLKLPLYLPVSLLSHNYICSSINRLEHRSSIFFILVKLPQGFVTFLDVVFGKVLFHQSLDFGNHLLRFVSHNAKVFQRSAFHHIGINEAETTIVKRIQQF